MKSIIEWQTGNPNERDIYLVYLVDGSVKTDEWNLSQSKWEYYHNEVLYYSKLSDVSRSINKDLYVNLYWPDYQDLEEEEGFDSNCEEVGNGCYVNIDWAGYKDYIDKYFIYE